MSKEKRVRVQQGTSIKEMNGDEQEVLSALKRAGKTGLKLKEIAGKSWEKKGVSAASKGGSKVRNALRRLTGWGFAKKAGKGTYVFLSDTATRKEAIEPKARASSKTKDKGKAKLKVVKSAKKAATLHKAATPKAATPKAATPKAATPKAATPKAATPKAKPKAEAKPANGSTQAPAAPEPTPPAAA